MDEAQTQNVHKNEQAINALDSLLQAAGYDAGDLSIALEAINRAKELKNKNKQNVDGYSYYLDKTLIYEDQEAFIFKRSTSISGRWYFKFYDSKSQKPVIKSLKTLDKTQALTTARMLYIEIKGKIERGERLKSITAIELVYMWEEKLKAKVSDVPHEGLTRGTIKTKQTFLKNWLAFINEKNLSHIPIDKIAPHKTREFGVWLKNKPKSAYGGRPRSIELTNSNISEVEKMYRDLAIRDKYLSRDNFPEIDRLKMPRDGGHKRDILTEEQYERFWQYIQFRYITKKHNPNSNSEQIEKRKIWKEFIFILSNVGFRPNELLGIRMNEIMDNPQWDSKRRETDLLMKVRRDNSKTGKARVCVAPVRKRIDRILASYKKLGVQHESNDYLFINPNSKTRNYYTRDIMHHRLREVLKDSGLQAELDKENKQLSLYSFRHQYATWRLRYGDVPIHLLSKQMGTSVKQIEIVYGHIQVEHQADKITKAQKPLKKVGFTFDKPDVIGDDEIFTITEAQDKGYQVTEVINKTNKKVKS